MSLADALAFEAGPKKGPPCTVGVLLSELSQDDYESLTVALGSEMTSNAIGRAIKAVYPERRVPSGQTIARHRKGDCACQ